MGTRELDAHVTRVLSWKGRVTETLRKPRPTSSFTKEKPDVQREESALNIALCSSFVTIPGQEDGHAEGRAAGMEKAQLRGSGLLEFHQCDPHPLHTQASAYAQPTLPTSFLHTSATK